ncbi:MAG: 16S rRNA (cytidine(1402)-2'-O)-methyltransferase, partial [Muribaculaceae bacterium]|nr:16S rRNA (cytidine(1402)-2'-O)-methyltransferase [Muribaculaceae bacterium]
MAGKLYIVPTPVGNLGDMAPRSIEILKSVSLILAEDTRTSGVLMKQFDIATPLVSHHKYNEHETVGMIAQRLEGGENIALVSDAGTPGISDPGFLLARECRRQGIEVETIPGPTAFVPALVNSGLPCDRLVFEGFLPQKKRRASRIETLAAD